MSEIDSTKILQAQILSIVTEIRTKFPSSYKLLDETPLLLTGDDKTNDFLSWKDYLQTLKKLLESLEKNPRLTEG